MRDREPRSDKLRRHYIHNFLSLVTPNWLSRGSSFARRSPGSTSKNSDDEEENRINMALWDAMSYGMVSPVKAGEPQRCLGDKLMYRIFSTFVGSTDTSVCKVSAINFDNVSTAINTSPHVTRYAHRRSARSALFHAPFCLQGFLQQSLGGTTRIRHRSCGTKRQEKVRSNVI